MGLSRPQQIGNVTHNQLTGRGESDSHPQSSISNLVETLSALNTVLGGKLSVEDIVNDLTTGGATKPASAEMVKTLNDTIALIDVTGVLRVGDVQDTLTSNETQKPLSANKGRELFQYANDGKGLIATAITNRGVVADSSETFSSLAGKIGSIAPAPSVVGNVTVDKVLAPYTFSTATLTGVTGTMTDRGAVTLTPGASAVAIPSGYHNGAGVVSAVTGLSAGNIANGVTVGGVLGSYKGIGTATAGDVLTGKTFSTGALSGASGTMVNQGAKTLTPGASAVTIPAGYHNGSGVVSAVTNLTAGNIKAGVTVGGVLGTYQQINLTGSVIAPDTGVTWLAISGSVNNVIYMGSAKTTNSPLFILKLESSSGYPTVTLSSTENFWESKTGTYVNSITFTAGGVDSAVFILNPTKATITLSSTGYNTSGTSLQHSICPLAN